jgi:multiple sugar transport system permease protein
MVRFPAAHVNPTGLMNSYAVSASHAPFGWRTIPPLGTTAFAYLLFLPAFGIVAAVTFWPTFAAVRQSLHDADYLVIGPFVGFANYVRYVIELQGAVMLWRSVVFVVGTLAVALPLGIGLALALTSPIRFRGLFRSLLILPWLVSSLLSGFLWAWLLDGHFSPLGPLLKTVGIVMPTVVTSPSLAMPGLILANTWHSYPLVMVLTMAAIQTIPSELIESAKIDGATALQMFFLVKLPLIAGPVMVAMVLVTLNTFNNATLVFAMTGGGPIDVTTTTALAIFLDGVKFFRIPIAAVGSVVCLLVNLMFAIAYMRVLGVNQLEDE